MGARSGGRSSASRKARQGKSSTDDDGGATRASTREVILAAAERLFAERGLDAVSMNEVNRAAGQRNTAAVFYHFQNKSILVDSILDHHQREIDIVRGRMLDRVERSKADATLRDLVEILVTPLVHELESPGGRAYVRIQAQLEPTRLRPMPETRRLMTRMGQVLGSVGSAAEVATRSLFATILLFHALAHRARDEEGGVEHVLERDSFAAALVDAIVSMIRPTCSSRAES